ncbi:MAG TPA: isochorismatase family protein [Hellea balneolensis]|uniref:Isochorismatase family protein n=1 Tax=Hellea balneolensis TaxID=287478 RepID=A0A7C3C5M6_9PROT|nr:isochorismatase family protein [Hellea balneolensis]
MIRGFTDPACPLGGDYPSVIAANQALLRAFRAAHLPVFFTTVIYRSADQAQVFRARVPALNVLTPNSKWVDIDPALGRKDNEPIIEKQWASAFFKTDLDDQLRNQNVDSLVVTGLTTSGCVRASALDGLQYDYKVFVPREAVGDRNQDAHQANLFDLHAKYADVVSLDDILTSLKGITS